MAKKLLLLLVVVAILAAAGFFGWQELNKPKPAPPAPAKAVEAAPAPAPEPEKPAGPLALEALGIQFTTAAGWTVAEDAPEKKVIPGGQAVVLRKGSSKLPLLVIGKIGKDILGETDPKGYPATFIAKLASRLARLQPAPTVSRSGAVKELPKLLTAAQELVAVGEFPDLGVKSGAGRFVAGTTADGDVYLIVAFSTSDGPDAADTDKMLASLEKLVKPEPTAPAADKAGEAPQGESLKGGAAKGGEAKGGEAKGADAAPAEAPKGEAPKAEAPKTEAPSSDAPKGEAPRAPAKPAAPTSQG